MPEKNISPGINVLITGNIYDDPKVTELLSSSCLPARIGLVRHQTKYDEEWGQRWLVGTTSGSFDISEQDLSPVPDFKSDRTRRGFSLREFVDLYGSECSIQQSSLATEGAIWLGVDTNGHFGLRPPYKNDRNNLETDTGGRMHLSQGQVAALLPLLQHFAETGELP